MKQATLLYLFLLPLVMAQGQANQEAVFYTNKEIRYFFYLEQRAQTAKLFRLGKYLHKAGTGPSILYTDTLNQPPTGSEWLWTGREVKIRQSNDQLTLYFWDDRRNKAKSINLYPMADTQWVHTNLNHAYWLDRFFAMSKAVSNAFPLQNFAYWQGFTRWPSLDNKNLPYPAFRTHADAIIQAIQDSLTNIHTPYTATANAILNNIATVDYAVLKEGLLSLPPYGNYANRYFSTVINAVANNRPELFFQLADDLPDKQHQIFNAIYEKKTIKILKAVVTDSPAKKAFFKSKK